MAPGCQISQSDTNALMVNGRPQAASKILVFEIGRDTYGIDVGTVSEVIRPRTITPVPGAPNYVLGLINVRGLALPLFDLSMYLGSGADEGPLANVVLVGKDHDAIGIRVGNVLEIMNIEAAEIHNVDAVLADTHAELFDGIIAAEEMLIGVLRLESIVERLLGGSAV